MPSFLSDGIGIAYEVHGEGMPILCIHGFGSSGKVNWIDTGWVQTLTEAGYQAITFDNRGHGASRKLYDTKLYYAHDMATDAKNLLDHLGIEKAPVIGYSMGARIAAFLALNHPERVVASVWGGMGANLISGLADSETIISALTAESLDQVKDRIGRQFRPQRPHAGQARLLVVGVEGDAFQALQQLEASLVDHPVQARLGPVALQRAHQRDHMGDVAQRGQAEQAERLGNRGQVLLDSLDGRF